MAWIAQQRDGADARAHRELTEAAALRQVLRSGQDHRGRQADAEREHEEEAADPFAP
ncbi:MAG: hypothetical protein U0166_01865 [Acidobacteriota bacterium]